MFSGSMVALVTPMKADGTLDWPALERLVALHLEHGTDGIVAVGTTGESATLSVTEHCEVIRRVVALAAGRVPVIAGTGANSTSEAIELTRAAKEARADGCLLVTPYYNKPTQEGLFLHHKAVAEAVAIPQILYNVPSRTACDMSNETAGRLADIPNIVGIKDATGDMTRGRDLIERVGGRMMVYSGDDPTGLSLMLLGGEGVISVTANVAPALMATMCDAVRDGDAERAGEINDKLLPLHQDLFLEANPIPVKWALHEMGLIDRGIRLPLTELSAPHHQRVRAALVAAELLPA